MIYLEKTQKIIDYIGDYNTVEWLKTAKYLLCYFEDKLLMNIEHGKTQEIKDEAHEILKNYSKSWNEQIEKIDGVSYSLLNIYEG